jgi:hypothetical protein
MTVTPRRPCCRDKQHSVFTTSVKQIFGGLSQPAYVGLEYFPVYFNISYNLSVSSMDQVPAQDRSTQSNPLRISPAKIIYTYINNVSFVL